MNKNLLKIVLEREELFVPLIFTKKQFSVLEKYNNAQKLTNSEKKSLYTSIKKKMEALETIKIEKENEFFINGYNNIIPERLEEAKKMINNLSKKYKKIFISGSFLFSEKYNDIDIFIIREKGYKEKWEGNKHIVFLTEKKLTKPVFQSAAMISVSNFILLFKIILKKPTLSETMSTYHEAVIKHMDKAKKPEMLRSFVFDYYLFCKDKLLNGKELELTSKQVSLDDLDLFFKELCLKLFSKKYLYVEIHEYIKTLEDTIKSEKPNEHLIRYKNNYEELIYGKRRAETEAV